MTIKDFLDQDEEEDDVDENYVYDDDDDVIDDNDGDDNDDSDDYKQGCLPRLGELLNKLSTKALTARILLVLLQVSLV